MGFIFLQISACVECLQMKDPFHPKLSMLWRPDQRTHSHTQYR